MLCHRLEDLIGNTPLLHAERYAERYCPAACLLCKLESFNPTGSAKDRAALFMLADAEKKGLLSPGAVLIEPTSGNTGIGLASLAAARGYRLILTMPDTMSEERRRLLSAYGAEILLTPGKDGMQGAIDKAHALAKELPNAFIPSQFDNPANPDAHFCTTGPEILRDCGDGPLLFVAGVGTGGTLTGVGRCLKKANPKTRVIAVEPKASPVLSGGASAPHGLQGIGANFVPENFDASVCDEILAVSEEDACLAARRLAKSEGLLVGISSGAALHAATLIASRPENAGMTVVVLLPDTGERYLSTPLFAD
jgi:cysteine synthase A